MVSLGCSALKGTTLGGGHTVLAPHIDALVDGLLGQGAVVRLDEVDLVVAGGDGLEAVSLFPVACLLCLMFQASVVASLYTTL